MSPHAAMPHATIEHPHRQSGLPGKWRPIPQPLDLSAIDEESTPSRSEKLGRRESRLGLKSIFGRTKTVRQSDGPPSPRLSRIPQGAGENATQGIPYYSLPPGKPIPSTRTSRPLSTTIEEPDALLEAPVIAPNAEKRKTVNSQSKFARGSTTGDAPPMHKAIPQAVKYSTLPAATASADIILKSHEKVAVEASPASDLVTEPTEEKAKHRRRRRAKSVAADLEWTRKTYILLASGTLLEYSGEGPFDRQPEKVLRLNRYSAAFASDLIPGRHWVLQVASAMGSDGSPEQDHNTSKSFFLRFPFRGGADKRSTSNMLLVFESAEDMDEWLVTLRQTIESVGGKKSLSETGKPKSEIDGHLREQASQRTLLVRDSDRFSRQIAETAWDPDSIRRESQASFGASESIRDQSLDDASATNSMISQDGQQLESLRSSAHRLSYISSGQRTMVTSAGSSPACSPTAESFSLPLEEPPPKRHLDVSSAETRLRPNANAIIDRRKSLQTMSPFVEPKPNGASQRPQSTLIHHSSAPSTTDLGGSPGNSLAPNFSVPSSRRFSSARMASFDASPPLSPPDEIYESELSPSRRPPTALRISRPLSMVMDQPSSPREREQVPERPATRHGESPRPSGSEDVPLPPLRPELQPQSRGSPKSNSSLGPQSPPRFLGINSSPRRLSSMGALRKHGDASLAPSPMPLESSRLRPVHSPPIRAKDPERCFSSVDTYGLRASPSSPARSTKRASMLPFLIDHSPPSVHEPPMAPPPSGPLPPVPGNKHLRPDASGGQGLPNRKSMTQLAEGPPPVPPPTCALPPIPQKDSPK